MNARKWLTLTAALWIAVLMACTPAATHEDVPDPSLDGTPVDVPEGVRQARDTALSYVESRYGLPGLAGRADWSAANIVQPNIVGQQAYRFLSGDWVVAVSYPVVAPENMLYTVEITNAAENFVWEGVVFPDGSIAEPTEDVHPDAVLLKDHSAARDAALAFVTNRYVAVNGSHSSPGEIAWTEVQLGKLLGYTTYLYTCSHWEVEVGAPVVALENVVYDVRLVSLDYGFTWEGTVDAFGRITELRSPLPLIDEEESR